MLSCNDRGEAARVGGNLRRAADRLYAQAATAEGVGVRVALMQRADTYAAAAKAIDLLLESDEQERTARPESTPPWAWEKGV